MDQAITRIVIYGASGHARVVADVLMSDGIYEIAGFIDDVHPERHGTTFCGATVLGGREQIPLVYADGIRNSIVAVGDCTARLRLSARMRGDGFNLITAIHPKAVIARDVSIGNGTVVAGGAVINPGVQIDESVIINTSASIDHECRIEAGAHISPGARLAGRVSVGRGTWIGIGATIIDRVRIGAGVIIGAGAVVVNDIPDGVLAYGVPARVVRQITTDEQLNRT